MYLDVMEIDAEENHTSLHICMLSLTIAVLCRPLIYVNGLFTLIL